MPLAGCIRKVSTRSQPIIPDHRKDPVPDRTCKRYGLTDGEIPYPIVHSLEKEFPDCKLQQDGSFLFKGAAAGAFAAASTLGGTAVLGTASTGTAIASLHGAAAAGAALASLGGGSLAAGGLGIAGGVALWGQPLPCRLLQPADTCGIKVFANNIRRCWLTKRP